MKTDFLKKAKLSGAPSGEIDLNAPAAFIWNKYKFIKLYSTNGMVGMPSASFNIGDVVDGTPIGRAIETINGKTKYGVPMISIRFTPQNNYVDTNPNIPFLPDVENFLNDLLPKDAAQQTLSVPAEYLQETTDTKETTGPDETATYKKVIIAVAVAAILGLFIYLIAKK